LIVSKIIELIFKE